MSDVNVYVDAEDNISIKDDKQIIKLQVRFEDLTENQKQQLKGEKGDRGEKGQKGDPGEPGPIGLTGPAPDVSEFMVKDELEQIIIELKKINGGN